LSLVPSVYPKTEYDPSGGTLTIVPRSDTKTGTRYVIKTVVMDPDKFRITQNIIVIVYRGSNGMSDTELEKEQVQMMNLLQ
jgi:hypothetical protein